MPNSYLITPKTLEESVNIIYSRGMVNNIIGAFFIKECQDKQVNKEKRKVPVAKVELDEHKENGNENYINKERDKELENIIKEDKIWWEDNIASSDKYFYAWYYIARKGNGYTCNKYFQVNKENFYFCDSDEFSVTVSDPAFGRASAEGALLSVPGLGVPGGESAPLQGGRGGR